MSALNAIPEQSPPPVLEIAPSAGWRRLGLHELWQARELLWFLTSREIKGRYRQMALGPLWIVLKPLFTMVVFTIVFGGLAKLPSEGIPYPIFTFTALLPWTFFQTAADFSSRSLVQQLGLISKVYFPRLVVPLAAVGTAFVDLLLSLVILAGMMAWFGIVPTAGILALPLAVGLAAATALAIGLWTAALSVRFRDLPFALTVVLQGWLYATPVAYSASLVPERWRTVYELNPLFWVIELFRWGLLGAETAPELLMLAPVAAVLALLVSGAYVFRRTERTVVDHI